MSEPISPAVDGGTRGGAESNPVRIEALIRLLGDDNPKIHQVAWNELELLGAEAVPWLQQAALRDDDAAGRLRARRLLSEHRRRHVLEHWRRALESEALDLESGAITISRSEYPNEEENDIRRRLDDLAEILQRRLRSVRTAEGAVQRLAQFLSVETGFTGDGVEYDDPDSSYLHRVLETKRGLPILLSTVYLCVARRVGIPLEGVGMPQHFILRYGTSAGEFFLDPFHDGRSMTRHDCRRFLERNNVPFKEAFLRPVSDLEMLVRMLKNLLRVYQVRCDEARGARIVEYLRVLLGEGFAHLFPV
jgi:regulator of sirC expression with transglutaminase-like and TPR domain